MELCRLEGIHMQYGKEAVLRGLDLSLPRNSIIGLVGPNGSGKSTLLKILAGILRPDAGALKASNGRPKMGYMPENCQWYPYMTGTQVLRYFARYTGASEQSQEDILKRVGLWEARDKKIQAYSKGMRQKLGLAQAIGGHPDLLILDEPTNGLDPRSIADFYDILRERVDADTTVVLSSHLLSELEGQITHVAFLHGGHIVASGSCDQLIERAGLPYRIVLRGLPFNHPVLRPNYDHPGEAPRVVHHRKEYLELGLQRTHVQAFVQRICATDIHLEDIRVLPPSLDDLYIHLMAAPLAASNGHSHKENVPSGRTI